MGSPWAQTGSAGENREEAAGSSQRLRERERRRLMAIFALNEYAGDFAGI
jgi:hypothetical protein